MIVSVLIYVHVWTLTFWLYRCLIFKRLRDGCGCAVWFWFSNPDLVVIFCLNFLQPFGSVESNLFLVYVPVSCGLTFLFIIQWYSSLFVIVLLLYSSFYAISSGFCMLYHFTRTLRLSATCDQSCSVNPVNVGWAQNISLYLVNFYSVYFTAQVMKPMLERKRRARINKCLDELKDLMVSALQAEGENVSKLEKADILELTVRHLHKLRRQQRLSANPVTDADRFRAGFTHCATEVSRCLAATPGVDVKLGTKLMTDLAHRLNDMDKMSPLSVQVGLPSHPTAGYNTPPGSPLPPLSTSSEGSIAAAPVSVITTASYYVMPLTPASSTSSAGCGRNSTSPTTGNNNSECGGGLLKLADVTVKNEYSEPIWRPW